MTLRTTCWPLAACVLFLAACGEEPAGYATRDTPPSSALVGRYALTPSSREGGSQPLQPRRAHRIEGTLSLDLDRTFLQRWVLHYLDGLNPRSRVIESRGSWVYNDSTGYLGLEREGERFSVDGETLRLLIANPWRCTRADGVTTIMAGGFKYQSDSAPAPSEAPLPGTAGPEQKTLAGTYRGTLSLALITGASLDDGPKQDLVSGFHLRTLQLKPGGEWRMEVNRVVLRRGSVASAEQHATEGTWSEASGVLTLAWSAPESAAGKRASADHYEVRVHGDCVSFANRSPATEMEHQFETPCDVIVQPNSPQALVGGYVAEPVLEWLGAHHGVHVEGSVLKAVEDDRLNLTSSGGFERWTTRLELKEGVFPPPVVRHTTGRWRLAGRTLTLEIDSHGVERASPIQLDVARVPGQHHIVAPDRRWRRSVGPQSGPPEYLLGR